MKKMHQKEDNNINVRNEQDSAWKQILDCYFKEFVDFFLPQLSELIDWDKGWAPLDKEFQALTKHTETGTRLLDKLFKVHLKSGQEKWVLVHVEVEASQKKQKKECFPERMFLYEFRIYDTYRRGVVGCAVLTDPTVDWRPNSYEVSVIPGSSLKAEFIVIKLVDYKDKTAELEASDNPFADVILVQLAAIGLRGKPSKQRKYVKFALTKRLYEKGYNKERVLNLYTFIDWLIGLSKPVEIEYLNDVHALEGATKVAYITSAERLGIEKGREEIKHEIAKRLLAGNEDVRRVAKITGLPLKKIKELKEKLLN